MELKWISDREGRLSSFLLGELKMSSSLMNKLKWGDAIQVNGIPQRTNYPVKPGDVVTVRLDEETPEFPAEETVLVQGIIDAYFIENGELILVDYKTDHVFDPQELRDRYQIQLDLYEQALSRITGMKVREKLIYSISLRRVISL